MDGISWGLRFLVFFCSASWIFLSAYSDDSSTQEHKTKTEEHSSIKGSRTLLVCLGVVAVALLSFFLFKFWQRKKREEQYARLLRLFEEDDELELELGLRD